MRPPAQGCPPSEGPAKEGEATLGKRAKKTANPERVASSLPVPDSALRTPHSALEKVRAVAAAAVSLRALRREIMTANGWSLRDLYRSLETPGANRLRDSQNTLDSAVRAAYGMKEGEEVLAFLLGLNLELADLETNGLPITPPGIPATIGSSKQLLSEDCIEARDATLASR